MSLKIIRWDDGLANYSGRCVLKEHGCFCNQAETGGWKQVGEGQSFAICSCWSLLFWVSGHPVH